MDKVNITDIVQRIINSDSYFDIKTLFNRHDSDSVNSRLLYNAANHKKLKGSLTHTNETDRELWPLFEPLGWLQQDDINAGDIASSFRTLFNHVITHSPNRDDVFDSIEAFNPTEELNDQYTLLVDHYAEFDWIKDNLSLFKQYTALVDTLGNIIVWDRIFNKFRDFDDRIQANFPLSLEKYRDETYPNDLLGWQTFIENNQLTMYVDQDYQVELFRDYPLPKTSAEFGVYLEWIIPKMNERNRQVNAKLTTSFHSEQ